MEFDFRHHPPRSLPARRLIEKALVARQRLAARPPHGPLQQLAYVALHIGVGRQADGVPHVAFFERRLVARAGTRRIFRRAVGLRAAQTGSPPATTYTYDPYGNPAVSGASSTFAFLYQGGEHEITDPQTLYYAGAGNFYNPLIQRSLSEIGEQGLAARARHRRAVLSARRR
jgi:hypothetical protein